ncbi:MAG: VTC domain-containing protein [Candidatus Electrothrix sp. ATG1]|nr:VTC domain-containing protein [Candidatus Electrothrix sp. ATG1]
MGENNSKKLPRPEHETKFVFHNKQAPTLIRWLQLRCVPDPQFPTGIISSIYYDTQDWLLLNEKLNSDYYKTKFRVRWYETLAKEEHPDRSFVEIKYKIGATRKKIRFESQYTGKELAAKELTDPELLELQQQARARGAKIPFSLYPAFQIRYKRFRFLEPKTRCRICIDYDIHAPRVNGQMLTCTKPLAVLNTGVVEVKGHIAELPDTLHQLTALGCHKQAFSKYGSCYSTLTGLFF